MYCLPFVSQLSITPIYGISSILFVLLRVTDYPYIWYLQCIVCPSSCHSFLLPLYMVTPVYCLSFFVSQITPIYGISSVLSVLLRVTAFYFPYIWYLQCIVCHSSCHSFLLPLYMVSPVYCLSFVSQLSITSIYGNSSVLSVLLRVTAFYYPYIWCLQCIGCPSLCHSFLLPLYMVSPVHCLSFFVSQLSITPIYGISSALSVLLRVTDYPYIWYLQCIVCPSSCHSFLLPLYMASPVYCLSFFVSQLSITPIYGISSVWSVLLRVTAFYYPYIWYLHCIVCPSSCHSFLLPLYMVSPVYCLSFFVLQLSIIPIYGISSVLSVLLRVTAFYYPYIWYLQCIVCPSCHSFLLPLYMVSPVYCLSFFVSQLSITSYIWYLQCIVCHSSCHSFLLPLYMVSPVYCLSFVSQLSITSIYGISSVLYVILRVQCIVCPSCHNFLVPLYMVSPVYCLSFFVLQLSITPIYGISSVLSVFFVAFYYPYIWYLQCIVCHSSCYSFLLPLYIVSPVYCLSFVSQLSITSIYGISSVLSVILRVTAFYYPYIWYLQCIVCPSSCHSFLLPLYMVSPVYCRVSFFVLQLSITPIYGISSVLSVILRVTAFYYPYIWYLQCIVCHSSLFLVPLLSPVIVCHSSCHSFLLPLYMVSPVYCLSFVSQLSITSIYGISSVLSVILRVTAFYYPYIWYLQCIVCPSCHSFLLPLYMVSPVNCLSFIVSQLSIISSVLSLPLYMVSPVYCLSFFVSQLSITPIYGISSVLSVLLRVTAFYYPYIWYLQCIVCHSSCHSFLLPLYMVSPVHCLCHSFLLWYLQCIVCHSSCHSFLLPLYMVSPVYCLSFFVSQLSITPIYGISSITSILSVYCLSFVSQLSITSIYGISSVLSVIHRVTAFYYPYIWYLQCIVCPSSCHSFLLPLYMVSPVYCLSFFVSQLSITPIYGISSELSVILRVTAFYYPYIWYLQCIVCHSSCHSFLLPLYMVSPVYCLSFFVSQLSITPIYGISSVLSVILRVTAFYYPYIWYLQCIVCPSSCHSFLLPLYMVSPVYCLSFFVSQLSITPIYGISSVLSVILRVTAFYYPYIWYLQCIVCHSSCHSFLLPLYMVSPVYCLSFVSQLSITSIYGISSVLSVLLRVTAFYFPYMVSPVYCLSFVSQLSITSIYGISSVLSVIHRVTAFYYPYIWYLQCIVCPSSCHSFLLPLYMVSPVYCLSFFVSQLSITPIYGISSVLSVILRVTAFYYPYIWYLQCIVCHSSCHSFLLPLYMVSPVYCLSFFVSQLSITLIYGISSVLSVIVRVTAFYYPIYGISSVLSVILRVTAFYYPYIWYLQCIVCHCSCHSFLLPLYMVSPVYCLSFFVSQLSITPIYGFSIVLSVIVRVTAFYYPYIWYLQCIVCHSSCHSFLLPLYMVSPVYCLSFFVSQLSITPIYGISSVLSVLLRVTAFYYLYIWYLQCIVCHSSCHSFLLPLYMVSPVHCLSFFVSQLSITPIYGISSVFSVILRVTVFCYPYIWYLQCIVCHSSCHSFLLPLYMVSPVYCLSFFVSQLSITPIYGFSSVLSVLLRVTDYPYIWYLQCIVCPFSCHRLPLYMVSSNLSKVVFPSAKTNLGLTRYRAEVPVDFQA